MMRISFACVTLLVAQGCATAPPPPPPPPPEDLAASHRYTSNPDGFVYRVAYFTRQELGDTRWEAKRSDPNAMPGICDNPRIVRRDVRWYPKTERSRVACAAVVYSLECAMPLLKGKPGSNARDRAEALAVEPDSPIERDCGEKDRSRIPTRNSDEYIDPDRRFMTIVDRAGSCEVTPRRQGKLRLAPNTLFSVRTRIDANLVGLFKRIGVSEDFLPRTPSGVISVAQHLSDAPKNQFLEHRLVEPGSDDIGIALAFHRDDGGDGYCVELTARQGKRLWRQSLARATAIKVDSRSWDRKRFGSPDYWDPYTDAKLLSRALAKDLGVDVSVLVDKAG